MNNISSINGTEKTADSNTPISSLIYFYKAFNNKNLSAMENNWLQNNNVSMCNPLGGIKRGWPEIKSVYDKIFNGPTDVYVEFYDFTINETDNMFFTSGRERGYLKQGNLKIDLAIRTSRIYIKSNHLWRQVHHHGSIDKPELLKQYQSIILQNS